MKQILYFLFFILVGSSAGAQISKQQKSAAIDSVVKLMNERYIFPETAKQIELHLRKQESKKVYDTISNGDVFAAALSGKTATNGLLAFLNPLNPAAKRVKGDAKAIECINNQSQYTGKVTVPTITLSQTADNITPAGYVQTFKNCIYL